MIHTVTAAASHDPDGQDPVPALRPVQDEADAVSGERKQVERVQTEGRVLRRQRVDSLLF